MPTVELISRRMKVSPARRGLPWNTSLKKRGPLDRLVSTLWMPVRAGRGTT